PMPSWSLRHRSQKACQRQKQPRRTIAVSKELEVPSGATRGRSLAALVALAASGSAKDNRRFAASFNQIENAALGQAAAWDALTRGNPTTVTSQRTLTA